MTKYFKHFVISRQYDEWWEICQKSSTASLEMNHISSLPRTCCWPQHTLILLFSSSFQTRIWKGDKYLAFTYDRSFYWYFWWVQKLSCGECTLPWGSSWLLVSWSSYQFLYCLQINILVRNWAKLRALWRGTVTIWVWIHAIVWTLDCAECIAAQTAERCMKSVNSSMIKRRSLKTSQ